MITQEKGRVAEEKALAYLMKQGLKLITQNYNCRLGEIDLIMRDKNHLVFIEVSSRVSAVLVVVLLVLLMQKGKK